MSEPDVRTPSEAFADLELSVSAVARRLGVAPATLRTWDRRYGIGPGRHEPGKHRRYSGQDVARLELMHRALMHGASPADAARRAIATTAPEAVPVRIEDAGTRPAPSVVLAPTASTSSASTTSASTSSASTTSASVSSGGVLRMPGAGEEARGLARAVLAMDSRSVQLLLLNSIGRVGVVDTWDTVVRPVLVSVAERWALTGAGIELEHLLSEAVTTVMARVMSEAPAPVSTRSVLLGSMRGDDHFLPARVLAATLAQRGVATSVLGADLPVHAIAAAVTRTAPAAVFLWAQLREHADEKALAELPRSRPRTRCFVGGPGWDPESLGGAIMAVTSLGHAVAELSTAAGLPA